MATLGDLGERYDQMARRWLLPGHKERVHATISVASTLVFQLPLWAQKSIDDDWFVKQNAERTHWPFDIEMPTHERSG